MSRKCKVCNSEHRIEYELKRKNTNMSYRDLEEYAKEEYSEDISFNSFNRHFNNHVGKSKEKMKKRVKESNEEFVKEEIDETLDVINELKNNLGLLKKMLKKMVEKEDLNSKDISSASKLIKEIRITLTTLSDLTNDLKIDEVRQDEITEFYEVISEMPDEYAKKIIEEVNLGLEEQNSE